MHSFKFVQPPPAARHSFRPHLSLMTLAATVALFLLAIPQTAGAGIRGRQLNGTRFLGLLAPDAGAGIRGRQLNGTRFLGEEMIVIQEEEIDDDKVELVEGPDGAVYSVMGEEKAEDAVKEEEDEGEDVGALSG